MSDGSGAGYFSSPGVLSRTASKLSASGVLDPATSRSVEQCLRVFNAPDARPSANPDAEELRRRHLPSGGEAGGEAGEEEAAYLVQELARIVGSSLANYAKAASEREKEIAVNTIKDALKPGGGEAGAGAGGAGGDDGEGDSADGRKTRLVFSELSEREKEKFMQFLVRNKVAFTRQKDTGEYVARVRMIPKRREREDEDELLEDDSSISSDVTASADPLRRSKPAARPPNDQARIVRAMAEAQNDSRYVFQEYPKFSALISNDKKKKPRVRPLPWLLRLIEDVYQERLAFDRQRMNPDNDSGAADGEDGMAEEDRLAIVFPVFVIDFFSLRYGVRPLVDQNAVDLLQSVHQYREDFLEVEIFARFLETFYSPEDLLFFLYARSILEKHLGQNFFQKRWTDLGPKREKLHESTWVSEHVSAQVCRIAFRHDELSRQRCRECLDLVHEHSEPVSKKNPEGAQRIRVIHLLQLMLDQYHRSRPAQTAADSSAFLTSQQLLSTSNSSSPSKAIKIESKDEQDRLFREAERHFEEFAGSRSGRKGSQGRGGDGHESTYLKRAQEEREKRIKLLEQRIREEIANKRQQAANGGALQDQSHNAAQTPFPDQHSTTDELLNEIDENIHGSAPAEEDPTLVVELLAVALERKCAEELSAVRRTHDAALRSLPEAFSSLITSQMQTKLQKKVEDMVTQLVDNSPRAHPQHLQQFNNLQEDVAIARARNQPAEQFVDHFAAQLLASIRPQLESFFGDLVKTAEEHAPGRRWQQQAQRAAVPHKVHINRRGSVDITLGSDGEFRS